MIFSKLPVKKQRIQELQDINLYNLLMPIYAILLQTKGVIISIPPSPFFPTHRLQY